MRLSRLGSEALWVGCAVLLAVQLHSDVLGVLDPAYKSAFQADSDQIALNRMQATGLGVLEPMVDLNHDQYLSQFGLQGIVMALLSPGDDWLQGFRWASAALLAVVLVAGARALGRATRPLAGVVLVVTTALAPWLNAFAVSTYWQLWMLLLPTVAPLLLWPRLRRDGRWWPALALVAGLVGLKALCGYEFITTVILGAASAACFHEFRGRIDLRVLKAATMTVLAGIAGFGAAMACHVVQLTVVAGGPGSIRDRSSERTFSPENFDQLVSEVRPRTGALGGVLFDLNEHLGLWAYFVRGYLFESGLTVPVGSGAGLRVWIGAFVVLFLVIAAWRWRTLRRTTAVALVDRLAVASAVALAAAASWLVLAYGHAINHPHIDAIVFFVPFVPLCCALVIAAVLDLASRGRGLVSS